MAPLIFGRMFHDTKTPHLPFFSYVYHSHVHPHGFNNLLDGYSTSVLGKGYDWSIIPTCFINHRSTREHLESQAMAGKGLRLWETWLRLANRSLCWLLYCICGLNDMSCDCGFIDIVPVPPCWPHSCELDVAAQEIQKNPTFTMLHCTWQLGNALKHNSLISLPLCSPQKH